MKTITGMLISFVLVAPAAPAAAQEPDWTRDLDRIADYAIAMAADALDQISAGRDEARAERERRAAERAREAQQRARERRANRGNDVTEQFTRTVRLGRTGRLELSNLSGDVEITGGGGEDVKIVATKVAHAATENAARAALRDTDIQVSERPGFVTIKAEPTRGLSSMAEVDYVITVPAGTSMSIQTFSGDVRVKGVDGEVRVQSLSGEVRVSDAKSRGIDLNSVSGDVVLEQIDSERVSINSISGSIDYRGRLAKSGRYELRTNSGDVDLVLDGNPGFDVEAQTFSGEVNSDFALTLRSSGLPRNGFAGGGKLPGGEIRGTFNDGGALLMLRSFSGDITIKKR